MGVDLSAGMLDYARRRAAEESLTNVAFLEADAHWGMHAVHGAKPELTAAIVDAWRDNAANGLSGRRLPALLADAGMRDITIAAETMTSTDARRPRLPPFTTMPAAAERCGAITEGDAHLWLAPLADAGRRGRFFWVVTRFAVAGARP